MAIDRDRSLSVSLIDEATFGALRDEWDELFLASSVQVPFLAWEWLFPWWQTFGGRRSLRLIAVREGAQLVAIAPLQHSVGRLGLGKLEFLGTGEAGSDYLDLIIRRGFEGRAIDAIANHLHTLGIALHLSHLPANAAASVLMMQLESKRWSCRVRPAGACPLIRLDGHTFDSYLATRGRAHRANVRRRLRSAARRFDLRFERVAGDAARGQALDALARFHERRFRGKRRSTAFSSAPLRAFHAAAAGRAQERGRLRLFALYLDDVLAGVMYAIAYDRRFFFYQHGFDDRYRAHGIGLMLMALTIKAAIEEGAIEFDLLWGVEPYKWLWADAAQPLATVDAFPAGLVGQMQEFQLDAESMLRPAARRLRAGIDRVA